MAGLRVVPTWRHGQERYYVLLPDGRNIAWYDREAGRVNLLGQGRREAVLRALAPYLSGPVTVGPPPVPTPSELVGLSLHPDDDLAPNRPGEALLVDLDRDPAPPRRLRPDPRRRELTAEQAVGDALDRLEPAGWRILHSLPLPGGARIHHLLIGPGGLFCVHSLYARKQRVRIGDPHITVGRAAPTPLLRHLRHLCDRASLALTAETTPVLALAGPAELDMDTPPRATLVVQDEDLTALATLAGVLKPADVESLYTHARDRHAWLRV
ncbi:nuclease-related domain-containing protein [Streptomyces sp. NBC_01304]|uniref:nuclease-related domain-containing protein n=1 Tax=Streptomyces sp. NBC_01304 TaxID=2903818 RepID=UPI002E0F0616|nr:NERD domain-containing protein [Streptomyces sp. NBC_01304]